MKVKLFILNLAVMALMILPNVYADIRSYVWSYEYMTMRKGTAEIEYYHTLKTPEASDFSINTMKHQIEFEYGITDHLDIAVYQRFKQKNNKQETDFTFDASKLRMRYRLAEKNELPLDILFYLEYIRDADTSKPNVLEGKLILAKDIGRFNVVYNQIIKQEVEKAGEAEDEYSFGINYKVTPRFRVAFESKGNYTKEKYYCGPTISYAMNKAWVAFGIVYGLNNESDEIQSRLIFGIPL